MTVPLTIYGAVINHKGLIGRFLETTTPRFVGRISYSLYLWQQLFLIIPVNVLAKGSLGLLQVFPITSWLPSPAQSPVIT